MGKDEFNCRLMVMTRSIKQWQTLIWSVRLMLIYLYPTKIINHVFIINQPGHISGCEICGGPSWYRPWLGCVWTQSKTKDWTKTTGWWFKRCLKFFWKHTHQTVGLAFCRGEGESIQSSVATASLQWCTASWAGAEHWLSQELDRPCLRGTQNLKALPLVKAQGRYAISGDTAIVPSIFNA
jgi:hypothetical protein